MAKEFKIRGKSVVKDTLLILAKAGLVTVALTSPFALHNIARGFFKDVSRTLVLKRARALKRLKETHIIEVRELRNGHVEVTLTRKGRHLVHRFNLDTLTLLKPARWDNKWRVLIYDIPEYKRQARRAFSDKLRELGLYRLQKSVWVSPYPFLNEFEFLCGAFEINPNVHALYFETKEIPKKEKLFSYFHIR